MLKEELNVIKQGIINEVEGYEFYMMASKEAKDEEAKKSLEILAEEEKKHSEYLRELFEKMQDEEQDGFKLAFLADPPSPKIFKWENKQFNKNSISVSIFGTAVNLEKESVEFYEEAKENTKVEEAKKLFDLLIKWEKVHLEQFQNAYNQSMQDWWNEQNFAPF
ncbi:MAG: ferritin family protein [Tissierellales bacterium]|jgi:rubrerythrin|nr:ferritin family protein [Tissierellales bacterium]